MSIWVKLCGVRTQRDIEVAAAAGADAVGLVMTPSVRMVDLDTARSLVLGAPGDLLKVAVFYRPERAHVEAVRDAVPFDLFQAEPETLEGIEGIDVLPVVHDRDDLTPAVARAATISGSGRVLVESAGRGGKGAAPDWGRVATLGNLDHVVVAGGLTPDNVGGVVTALRPGGVDVSSGVESAPGFKDPILMERFVAMGANRRQGGCVMSAEKRDLLRETGRAGAYGGRYVPEVLMPALTRLEKEALRLLDDAAYQAELAAELKDWVGRPTPLTRAPRLGEMWGGDIWLKREDLAHTGAHKINNALGQAILAREMGATRVIAETGAGQHGVASAAACARVGLECTVYMGAVDIERQAPNVERMHLLGTKVIPVESGDRTLRAAINEAMRDWVGDPQGTYYLLGSAVGPHPYPWLVREIQSVIGREARARFHEVNGRLPDAVIACVGGGSNAIGLFHPFIDDAEVALLGVEAGGTGPEAGANAASIVRGSPGVLHGTHSYLLQDDDGQVFETHSVSAGLDYPGVGPEHAFLADSGRAKYVAATDEEALAALDDLARSEGILAALESSHALAGARRYLEERPGAVVLVGLSGRGDKDIDILRSLRR